MSHLQWLCFVSSTLTTNQLSSLFLNLKQFNVISFMHTVDHIITIELCFSLDFIRYYLYQLSCYISQVRMYNFPPLYLIHFHKEVPMLCRSHTGWTTLHRFVNICHLEHIAFIIVNVILCTRVFNPGILQKNTSFSIMEA